MLRRLFFLLLLFVCFGQLGFAQDTSGCLLPTQLTRLQYADIGDVGDFLTREEWQFGGTQATQTVDFFEHPFRFDAVRWNKYYSQNNGTLLLYGVSETNRLVLYQTNATCYAEIRASFSFTDSKTTIANNLLKTVIKREGLTLEFRESTDRNSGNSYSILVYNTKAMEDAIEAVLEQQRQLARLEAEKQERYLATIVEGDNLFKAGQFETAQQKYESVQQLEPKFQLREKINSCIRGIADRMTRDADALLKGRNYDKAMASFREAATFANKHSFLKSQADYAQKQISAIKDIKEVLTIRKERIFKYSETNAPEYESLKQVVFNDLSQQIATSPAGNLNLQYQISFDTLGANLSRMNSLTSTIASYENRVIRLARDLKLKPSMLDEFFIASTDMITLKANWNTYTSTFVYNSNGLRPVGGISLGAKEVESYLESQSFEPGKYTVSILEKNINDRKYRDININKYSTVGPEAAFLSLLMPGIGSLAVSHGETGAKRITSFLFYGGLTYAAQRYSQNQYRNYQTAMIQTEIDEYYALANISHKVSLVSAGIAASIYIHDFFWVLVKGSQNNRQARTMRKRLNQGGISIQNQPIQW